MMKRLSFLVGLAAGVCLALFSFEGAAPGFAGELTLFGPQRCERTTKKPNVYSFNFSSLTDQEGYILGTLLIWNGAPDRTHQVSSAVIWVNGQKVVGPDRFGPDVDVIQIPLDNLKSGNRIKVEVRGKPGSYLTFQIAETGPQGPLFSGPQQYPFVCRTEQSKLGQPLVDNYRGDGIAVFEEDDAGKTDVLAGYCKDCGMITRVDYYYLSDSGEFKPIQKYAPYPDDLAYTTTNEDKTVPYIVRLERGTINRFIYSIAMLRPWTSEGEPIAAWNGKLFFTFDGGVAIGHDQGTLSSGNTFYHDGLRRGYAVAYSTGNRTGVHYNLQLAGETAIMVKEHFVNRFGNPQFTMSIGGSGGAIQQYAFAQNHPGLLDGIIPQRSYSDMITQSIYVGDCMLMEFYFDVITPSQGDYSFGGFAVNLLDGTITYLGSPQRRTLLEGLSTSDTVGHPIYGQPGSTECVNGWLGLTPLVMNPLFTDVGGLEQFPDEVVRDVKWTHWDDLKNIYGVDENGYAPSTWDNVGVQYGLQSLVIGDISLERFLDINAKIGGWKKSFEMVPEGYPFSMWNEIQYLVGPAPNPLDFDPWSIRNSNFSFDGIAPRTAGDIQAMNAAYTSGHVFIGRLDIPALDIRDYLDPLLDMHHAQQSFATRKRIIDYQGDAANQVIWMTDHDSEWDGTNEAIDTMDQWLTNIQNHPKLGIDGNKPAGAVDKCVRADETEFAGAGVWDGIIDDNPPGACTQTFHLFSTSRIIAGSDIKGDVFKCYLIPVEEAVARGFYGIIEIGPETLNTLKAIFPDGVCDYSQGDAGRPEGWQ
ncbi:MAG: DUF6351 family protein [Desulfobacterales bacterium]